MLFRGLILCLIVNSCNLFAQQATELKLYRPFGDEATQQSIVIKQELKGQCPQQSQRIKREDAWRCSAEDKIYDPCFMNLFGAHKELICPVSPWLGNSIKIKLTHAINNSNHELLDLSSTQPWALELSTGERCQAIDAGSSYNNLPIHYQCDSKAILVGPLQRCKKQWSILKLDAQGLISANILKSWF